MDQEKIGRFLAKMRKERGLTQDELGEKLSVTNKTISRWETGKYMPDIDKLQELSALLSVSVNELLSGERIQTNEEFVQRADNNLLEAMSEPSTFCAQRRYLVGRRIIRILCGTLMLVGLIDIVYGALKPNYAVLIIGIGTLATYCTTLALSFRRR